MRHTLYQPNPPTLNTVPVNNITGDVTLNREQMERQKQLGRSFYGCRGGGFTLFAGLRSLSSDFSEGYYYWLFYWREDNPADSWVHTAPKDKLFSFVQEKMQDVLPQFREIVELTKPEDIGEPFIMLDRTPEICPAGPVTLIGDATHPMTPCEPILYFYLTSQTHVRTHRQGGGCK